MFKMFFELSMLAMEAQQAMWLRSMRIAGGGRPADREAKLMVTEKIAAAQAAATQICSGAAPIGIVAGYRRKVRANVRRLSK